jgi:secreted trypsin-like serine protease
MFQFRRALRRLTVAGAATAAVVAPFAGGGGTAQAIVGGVGVSPSIYPQFVKLLTPNLCGGTVIAADTVLTAAHCVDEGVTAAGITAFVRDVSPRSAVSITIHPLWDGDEVDGHDLAIVRLTPGSTAGVPNIQVGSPFDTSYYAPNTRATIVGHGRTSPSSPTSTQLRAVDTVLRSDDYMDDVYNPWYWFDHWNEPFHIGAGSSSQTACHGDSGGPLVVDKDGTWNWVQVGVASFVETWPDECAEPAGFSELANAQLAWVAQQVPSIKAAWGTCYTPSGFPGQASASYVGWFLPTGGRDGQFYWEIACYGIPSQPPPTTPTTTVPPDDPPIPPMCRTAPWKCPDL